MKSNAITRSLSRLLGGAPDTATHDAKADRGTKNQLAMLIDTENIPAAQMNEIMSRAKQYGEITHRLAFGPTTNGNWASTRLRHAIRWGRQSLVKTGKNSADIELAITAMELLLTDRSIGGFCIVSSDSDFTPLVMRLREANKLVVGFGKGGWRAAYRSTSRRALTQSKPWPVCDFSTGEHTAQERQGRGAPGSRTWIICATGRSSSSATT